MSKEQFDPIVTANIIKALLKSAEGLTIHKISDLMPNHIPIHALTDYLTNLRDQGMVYLVKGHLWRASGMFPAGAIIGADSGNAEESPWNNTRRLCRYYRDCNLMSGSKGMVLWPDRENKIYSQIFNRMNWQDLAMGEAVYLPEKALSIEIRNGLHREPQCYLCGPIYHTGNRGSLTPVFLNPCTVEWIKDKELLRITLTGYPELNEEWLNRIARNAEKRQDLVAYFSGEQLASSEALTSITVQPDLPQLYSRLRKLLEEDTAMGRQCVELPCLPSLDSATPFVDIKLGGYYNRLVLVRQDSAVFTQRLQKELNKISVASDSDLDASGLNILFPHRSADLNHKNNDVVLNSDEPCITAQLETLSPDQRKACHLAMHQPITVVTGPPGTGKSRVVANVMANALLEGKSVLFASRNHQAIDAVVPVLNKLVDNIPVVGRLSLPHGEQNVDPMRECLTAIFNNIIGISP
ncbi:MAG: hypothetical protein Q7J98_00655 [Kiritimatiellia bacterium]|nr:hypothetical protein [Kiritimatiellia bacterium]